MVEQPELTREEVLDFLNRWRETYDSGDKAFFDFFAPDATFFTPSIPTRVDGTEEYRRGFEPNLEGPTRRSQLLSPEITIIDGIATVSCHTRISVDGQTTNLQTSLVIARGNQGELKIIHLHNSPLSVPTLPPSLLGVGARGPEDITLLEERVASAAATVGTPK